MNKKFYIIIILFFLVSVFSVCFFKYKKAVDNSSGLTSLFLQYPDLGIKDMKISDYFDKQDNLITSVDFVFADKHYHKEYFGGLYNAYFYDTIGFSKPTLVVITGEAQTIYTYMLEINDLTNLVNQIKFIHKDKTVSDSMCCNFMLLIQKNDDIHYDIGMPDFSYKIPKIEKYEYNQEKRAFIEK